jgi:hypothetical protein
LVFALLAASPLAHAQPSAADKALAEELFRAGKRLMADGRIAEACAKLAESERIEPAVGTLLNLAVCHEKEGKTASAWAELTSAATRAARAGSAERADFARARASELEKRLSRVLIEVSVPSEGLRVTLNGKPIGSAAWGSAIPVDPGEVSVEATAPGRRGWGSRLTLGPGPRTETVVVPELEAESAAATPATPASASLSPAPSASAPRAVVPAIHAPQPETGTVQPQGPRTLGWIVGGVGLAAIGAGSYFGLRAFGKQSDVESNCRGSLCNAAGIEADQDAHRAATISTVAFAAGLAGVGIGAWIVFGSKSSDPPAARTPRVAPFATGSGAGVGLRGAW